MMRRKIYDDLSVWKEKKNRMPLILNGARQVGKTYILKLFGREEYDSFVYINLETNGRVRSLFEEGLTPQKIIEQMEVLSDTVIQPRKTLVILDEIQASERALTYLKSFCEETPDYHIVSAGSLLGVALNREHYSFPVGYVDEMTLFPLDFEEFLWANEKEWLADEIRKHFLLDEPLTDAMHQEGLEYYRKYLAIGGMPAAINAYKERGSLMDVAEPQQRILNEYVADMAKYSVPSTTVKIRSCYDSIPIQLAKENKKFQYKVVQKGGTATIFGEAIEWLLYAGAVLKCRKIEHGYLPISAYVDLSDFKLYMGDVGLLTQKTQMPYSVLLSTIPQDNTFMGGIAENFVAQALLTNKHQLFYWKNENRAELDFVIQINDKVVPVEVKSGRHTKSKSLEQFRKKYRCDLAYRISVNNFDITDGLKSIPLYAVFCIEK